MFFLKQCFTVQVYKSSITLLRHIFRNLPGLRIATNHRNDKYYKYYYYFFISRFLSRLYGKIIYEKYVSQLCRAVI